VRHKDGTIWWEATIGELARENIERSLVLPDDYPLTAPHLRATPEQIAEAERRLGITFDDQYRALLGTINGWDGVIYNDVLLSTDELGQGPLWELAQETFGYLYEEGPLPGLPPRDELLPVLVSPTRSSIMAIWTGGPVTDGSHPVVWIANELIDQWPTVYEWVLALTVLLKESTVKIAEIRAAQRGQA